MNIEWLNTNRYRSYPFREDSVFQGLPSWCLVDFYLVDTIDDDFSSNVTLVRVSAVDGVVTLTMSYRDVEFSVSTADDYEVHTVEVEYTQPDGQHRPVAHCVTGFEKDDVTEDFSIEFDAQDTRPTILPTRIIRKPGGSGVSSVSIQGGTSVPYDAEVEYLESTTGGGEYIATGFALSDDHSIPGGAFLECKYRTFTRGGSALLVIGRYNAANWELRAGDYANAKPDVSFGVNLSSYWGNIGSPTASEKTIRATPSTVTINGTAYAITLPTPTYLPTAELCLFCQTPALGTPSTFYRVRIYSFSAHGASGDIDLIPVRVGFGSAAVGYLYDRANPTGGPLGNGLYPNAGTGAFVIGPDVRIPQRTDVTATGRIHLATGCNCRMKIYDDAVNLDIGAGFGTGRCCEQETEDGCSSKLLFLNGQTADSDGNITLSGASGITVYPGETRSYTIPGLDINPVELPSVVIATSSLLK